MNSIKLMAFDLDDTLLLHGQMSDAVFQAVSALKKKAVTVCATSRDITQIDPKYRNCFSYIISASGACISDSAGNLIMNWPLEKELALSLVKEASNHRCKSFVYLHDHMLMSLGSVIRILMQRSIADIVKNKHSKWNSSIVIDIENAISKLERPIYKLHYLAKNYDDCVKVSGKVASEFNVSTTALADNNIEITSKHITKEYAFRKLCEKLGIELSETAAIGDSANDINLLKSCAVSVAMGNAEESVKKVCSFVTGSVREDGAVSAINRLFYVN